MRETKIDYNGNSDIDNNKKNRTSIKKNYAYNLIYQLFGLITPLVTMPYISRVLGSAGVGQYSFTFSIVSYFVILGSLGFGYYAQREIAKYQDNKVEQSKTFFEILIARLISVLFALVIHIIIILFGAYGKAYTTLMWILTINIVAVSLDVSFLFQGNEDFGIIVIRNVIIKVVGIVIIIVFVKNESHVWLYALCQSIILIVSNISLWTRLPKVLVKFRFKDVNITKHFLPSFRLFIPTIAVSVYTILDKTLIGFLVPGTATIDGVEKSIADIENGFYDQSEKIVKMVMTIITSLGVVMIPRNSYVVAKGDVTTFKKNINNALRFVFFLGMPLMLGVAATSFTFSPWFFGDGYEKVPYLMIIMSPLIMIIGLSNVLGLQYLLPIKQDKKYTLAITSGAILNFILNMVLIHNLWSYGAAIATVAAEIVVTIVMFIFARKDINFFSVCLQSWKCILGAIVMFCAVFFTQMHLNPSIINFILLAAEGIIIYLAFLLILRDSFIMGIVTKIKVIFKSRDRKQ